jgi:glyoxalase family protein
MTNGIHHVTAIAGPAARNADFYTRVLGLRLIKKTVNFDDSSTYHLYYGDEVGHPGTILTFFPWEHAAPGRLGIGETQETVFRVPEGSLGFWLQRFIERGVKHSTIEKRFGESVLPFQDPDGTRLALAAVPGVLHEPAWTQEIASENAIRGFHSVSLLLEKSAPTGAILTDVLGFVESARDGNVTRYHAAKAPFGGFVDLREAGGFLASRPGAGSVHHIAFRAADDAEQAAMVKKLADNHGIHATEQKDRNYFRSVYFREPGHVLFEIATDQPGFSVDEPVGRLGQTLKLPEFLEKHRREIEAVLPPLT